MQAHELIGILNEHKDVTIPRFRRLWCKSRSKKHLAYFKHFKVNKKSRIRRVISNLKDSVAYKRRIGEHVE